MATDQKVNDFNRFLMKEGNGESLKAFLLKNGGLTPGDEKKKPKEENVKNMFGLEMPEDKDLMGIGPGEIPKEVLKAFFEARAENGMRPAPGVSPSSRHEKPPVQDSNIPREALYELLRKHAVLSEENNNLKKLVDKYAKDGEAGKMETPFKPLSGEEFEKLVVENPKAAMAYLARERKADERKREDFEDEKMLQTAVNEAMAYVITSMPDIVRENKNIMVDVARSALNNGADPEMLSLLADPRTKVIPYGRKKPIYLGKNAASFIRYIADSERKKEGKLSDEMKKTLESELRKEITKEILEKMGLKSSGEVQSASMQFKSLRDAPGNAGNADGEIVVTKEIFKRMSPEEQKHYLGG